MPANAATTATLPTPLSASRPLPDHKPNLITAIVFIGLLVGGLLFSGFSLDSVAIFRET